MTFIEAVYSDLVYIDVVGSSLIVSNLYCVDSLTCIGKGLVHSWLVCVQLISLFVYKVLGFF